MAFKIRKTETEGVRVTLEERVWLTRDGDLVAEGDSRAAVLYCAAGRSVLRDDYEERCAVKAPHVAKNDRPQVAKDAKDEEQKPKAKRKPKNKAKKAPANKGKGE